MKSVIVCDYDRGKRFDMVATEMLPMLSRAYVHVLIKGKRILLNGEQQKAGYKLRVGDVITTDFDTKEIDQIADIDLPILYEDDDVLVINKPEGIISHSRGRYWSESSVASFVRQKTKQEGERSGIVHRLDRATSGVMICAKNPQSLSWLQKQFSTRKVKKTYFAVVKAGLTPVEAIIDMPIERDPKHPKQFKVSPKGKSAKTTYRVTKSNANYSLIELNPETGRTHQLRVHLKQIKHPIIGDAMYGSEPASRLMLHATKLELTLPNKSRQQFCSELPDIFTEMVS